MRKIILTILGIFSMWVLGFAWFIYSVNSYKLNNNITNAIIVFAGQGQRVETAIALLNAGYAPILFITGIESADQLKNLMKEQNVKEQQVIYAPNKFMTEEDYSKKAADFIMSYNLTSVRLVTSNYNMPIALKELNNAISTTYNVNIIPNPVFVVSRQFKALFNSYNRYLLSFL